MEDERDYLRFRAEAERRLAEAAEDARAAEAHAAMAKAYARRLGGKMERRSRA